MITREQFDGFCEENGACRSGLEWLHAQPPGIAPAELWATCPNGYWTWWVIYECGRCVESDRCRDMAAKTDFMSIGQELALADAILGQYPWHVVERWMEDRLEYQSRMAAQSRETGRIYR